MTGVNPTAYCLQFKRVIKNVCIFMNDRICIFHLYFYFYFYFCLCPNVSNFISILFYLHHSILFYIFYTILFSTIKNCKYLDLEYSLKIKFSFFSFSFFKAKLAYINSTVQKYSKLNYDNLYIFKNASLNFKILNRLHNSNTNCHN